MDKLTNAEKITGGAAILLVLDLLIFPWHSFDAGVVSFSRTGLQSPNAFWGWLALLGALALVAVIALPKFTDFKLPPLPIEYKDAVFYTGAAAGGVLILKLVLETSQLGFGAFLGIVLGAAVAYGGYQYREEGGPAGAPPPQQSSQSGQAGGPPPQGPPGQAGGPPPAAPPQGQPPAAGGQASGGQQPPQTGGSDEPQDPPPPPPPPPPSA